MAPIQACGGFGPGLTLDVVDVVVGVLSLHGRICGAIQHFGFLEDFFFTSSWGGFILGLSEINKIN